MKHNGKHPLRRWREANRMSLAAVGESLGCSAVTVFRWEQPREKRRPSYARARKLERLTRGAVPAALWYPKSAAMGRKAA